MGGQVGCLQIPLGAISQTPKKNYVVGYCKNLGDCGDLWWWLGALVEVVRKNKRLALCVVGS